MVREVNSEYLAQVPANQLVLFQYYPILILAAEQFRNSCRPQIPPPPMDKCSLFAVGVIAAGQGSGPKHGRTRHLAVIAPVANRARARCLSSGGVEEGGREGDDGLGDLHGDWFLLSVSAAYKT